jgi:hypothetical protein
MTMIARWQFAIGQVLQVVLDVFARGSVFRSHRDQIQKVSFG